MQTTTDPRFPESDPLHHTSNIKGMLDALIHHLREDIRKFDEPKAQAMFETSAEVLLGLKKAFEDYEAGKEEAMRPASSRRLS